jgi:hypothetical protein
MDSFTVALVVIARDEAQTLPRLLSSVSGWVDSVMVLDTGSTDETAGIAARMGARVESFAWCDDFSAARNAALDAADADWNLVLDADEWLMDGGPWMLGLRSREPRYVGAISLEDRFECGAAQVARHAISRLLPRGVRYRGRIHEQPQHPLQVQPVPISVAHDGYQPQALARKRGRNRQLLLKDLADHPDDAYLSYQLGKDASVYDEHELADRWLSRAQMLAGPEAPWRPDLLIRRAYALRRLDRHEDAARLLRDAEEESSIGPRSADLDFARGDLMMDWAAADPGRAMLHLASARSAFTRCLEIGERPSTTGSVAGRGSHLAAHNLALVCEVMGDSHGASTLRRRFGIDSPSLLA